MINRLGPLKKDESFLGTVWMLLCICLIAGCVHSPAPYRPKSWTGIPVDMKAIAENGSPPRLQVIIVYGPAWCHHSALRLVCPGQPVLFWDPGGGYGISDPEDVRQRDLIRINPPDLETYLQFTWNHSSTEVEVFEWDLSAAEAKELYDVLVLGTGKDHPAGKFTTHTIGGFCSAALSDFLHRFASKTVTVPKSFFLPHNLAKVLYSQSPKRVLVFRRGDAKMIFVPPQMATGDPGDWNTDRTPK